MAAISSKGPLQGHNGWTHGPSTSRDGASEMDVKAFAKVALTTLGLILILLGVGALVLLSQVDRLAKGAIERALSDAFSTVVDFDSIVLSLRDQGAEIRGFSVANPETFKKGPAIECDRIRLEFDPTTLFSKSPVIREILIEGADIYYRYELGEGTNIGRIAEDIAENRDDPSTPRFSIQHLRCEDAEVHFSTNLIPGTRVGLPLVTVDLENIREDSPVTTRQAASIFLRSVLRETLTLRILFKPVAESLRREVERLGEMIGDN